jgi:hypothetical protein
VVRAPAARAWKHCRTEFDRHGGRLDYEQVRSRGGGPVVTLTVDPFER